MIEQNLLLLVAGVILTGIAIFTLRKRANLLANGLRAEGIVYSLTREKNSSLNSLYPVIRFLTDKSEWITEPANTGIVAGTYKQGDKVTVIYDPSNPKKFMLETRYTSLVSYILLIAGILLLLFAVYQSFV